MIAMALEVYNGKVLHKEENNVQQFDSKLHCFELQWKKKQKMEHVGSMRKNDQRKSSV